MFNLENDATTVEFQFHVVTGGGEVGLKRDQAQKITELLATRVQAIDSTLSVTAG